MINSSTFLDHLFSHKAHCHHNGEGHGVEYEGGKRLRGEFYIDELIAAWNQFKQTSLHWMKPIGWSVYDTMF